MFGVKGLGFGVLGLGFRALLELESASARGFVKGVPSAYSLQGFLKGFVKRHLKWVLELVPFEGSRLKCSFKRSKQGSRRLEL